MPQLTREYIDREYNKKQRSTHEIAADCNTYPNKVRRAIIKFGFLLRDRSEAQSAALKTGRHSHPTKGTKRPEKVKKKISDSLTKTWDELTDKEWDERSKIAKQQWKKMDEKQKQELFQKAAQGIREAAEHGSKLERYLLLGLRGKGYKVDFHKTYVISAEKQHLDLFLPDHNIAIEVDGPTHFDPIWGEEKLQKRIASDHKKNGLLINSGRTIIRVQCKFKNLTNTIKKDALEGLLEAIKKATELTKPTLIEVELTGE